MDRVDYESLMVQEFLGAYDRDELVIDPWYQRRAVWSTPQKAYLMNTIHESKPVPTIYIRHVIDLESEKTIKEVVDGQQRIRCIIEYRDDRFAVKHPNHRRPAKFSQLTKVERIRFLQTALSVGYLVGATDSDVIEIFARINSVAKTLNPQEKRNALFSGAFKQFCLQEAVTRLAFWRDHAIFTDNDIARMVEVQFVSDLTMNLREGLLDFSAARLTAYYRRFDEEFPDADDTKRELDRLFSQLIALPTGVLRSSTFARPQVLFSLLMVLNSLPMNTGTKRISECINDIDARVRSMRSGENPTALSPPAFEAFTTGNMHRIRFRQLRHNAIRERF